MNTHSNNLAASPVEPIATGRAHRAWRVLHACNSANLALPVIEGQSASGMKPHLITSSKEQSHSVSLLTAWNQVRDWRHDLVEAGAADLVEQNFDLVHAHCFSAGMAAVRSCPAVVYDIRAFVEEAARSPMPKNPARAIEGACLSRSFRVAEQFVLSHAAAVVVHSGTVRAGVLARGGDEHSVFQIPEPLPPQIIELLAQPFHPHFDSDAAKVECAKIVASKIETNVTEFDVTKINDAKPSPELSESGCVNFFAPDVLAGAPLQSAEPAPGLSQEVIQLLEMLVLLRSEVPEARMFLPVGDMVFELLEKALSLGVAEAVHAVLPDDCARVFAAADVVIASGNAGTTALRSMILRRPLLAADCDENRDLSPNGRGLLWYRARDMRDLACRAAFLARNTDLRNSLAHSAHKHLLETRTPEAVGRQYDAVYQYAFSHRKSSGATPNSSGIRLQPLVACF